MILEGGAIVKAAAKIYISIAPIPQAVVGQGYRNGNGRVGGLYICLVEKDARLCEGKLQMVLGDLFPFGLFVTHGDIRTIAPCIGPGSIEITDAIV